MVTNTTEAMELVETGERRDRLGRKITPADRRAELVALWRQSGLTQAAFARREGIIYSSFAAWVQAERRVSAGAPRVPKPVVHFAEVRLPAAANHGLEVRLPDGTVLRGGNAVALAALVRALRS
jgi:transposase-like protein